MSHLGNVSEPPEALCGIHSISKTIQRASMKDKDVPSGKVSNMPPYIEIQ